MRKEQCTELTGPVELLHDCFMLRTWDSPYSHFLRTAQTWVTQDKTQFKLRHIEEMGTQCLKTTEKVSFNIASEAGFVYILSGQKLIKNAENGSFWRSFENLKLAVKQCYQTGHF